MIWTIIGFILGWSTFEIIKDYRVSEAIRRTEEIEKKHEWCYCDDCNLTLKEW